MKEEKVWLFHKKWGIKREFSQRSWELMQSSPGHWIELDKMKAEIPEGVQLIEMSNVKTDEIAEDDIKKEVPDTLEEKLKQEVKEEEPEEKKPLEFPFTKSLNDLKILRRKGDITNEHLQMLTEDTRRTVSRWATEMLKKTES